MSTENNKAFVRHGFEDLNQGTIGNVYESLALDFVYHDAANPQVSNREEYTQFLTGILAAFAYQATIEDLIAEGIKSSPASPYVAPIKGNGGASHVPHSERPGHRTVAKRRRIQPVATDGVSP